MARDHFLDMQESGGEWWMEGWRCLNCGHVFDPVVEQNRRMHAAAMAGVAAPTASRPASVTVETEQLAFDLAA